MKLKLEAYEETPVIAISERISATQLAALKAGMLRLFKTAKSGYIVDISYADFDLEDHFKEVLNFKNMAIRNGVPVIYVSQMTELGHSPDRKTAAQKLGSRTKQINTMEASLKTIVFTLKASVADLQKKLDQAKITAGEIRDEKRKKTDLTRRILELDTAINSLFPQTTGKKADASGSSPPGSGDAIKNAKIDHVARAVLLAEGLLVDN